MDKLLDAVLILIVFYVCYRGFKKILRRPLLILKEYLSVQMVYALLCLVCLLIVPYNLPKGHIYGLIGTRNLPIDYLMILYEIALITTVFGIIRLIDNRKRNN